MPREAAHAVPASPSMATSYGQVIEYIQGAYQNNNTMKQNNAMTALTCVPLSRPTLPSIIHTPADRADPLPVPVKTTTVADEAIFARTSGARIDRTKEPPASLLYDRQELDLQRIPCRLWPVAHRPSLPLRCYAARGAGRSCEYGSRCGVLERSRREKYAEPSSCDCSYC
jgi:hypothetical protein